MLEAGVWFAEAAEAVDVAIRDCGVGPSSRDREETPVWTAKCDVVAADGFLLTGMADTPVTFSRTALSLSIVC